MGGGRSDAAGSTRQLKQAKPVEERLNAAEHDV
jgi:hypothetical protein